MEIKKGTTTVGMKCTDGVVLVTDSRASMGYLVSSKDARKIYKISNYVAGTVAGSVGDAEMLMKLLKAEVALYETQNKTQMTINAIANLAANILHGNRYFPLLVQVLICGYDAKENSAKVYSIDPVGGMTEENLSSTGSGSPIAYGVLESEYSENNNVEQNLLIGVKALKITMERDLATGNNISVVTITKEGYKEYTKEEIKQILENIKK